MPGVAAMALAATGCGDDEEEAQRTAPAERTETQATQPTQTQQQETQPAETEVETGADETEAAPGGSPEDRPGGVGDETPARSLALLTGREGAIRPRLVRVPAFIAIRVELRSADGRDYGLGFGGRELRVGGEIASRSVLLDGLRPGRRVRGVPLDGGNPVTIEATAEPGP